MKKALWIVAMIFLVGGSVDMLFHPEVAMTTMLGSVALFLASGFCPFKE